MSLNDESARAEALRIVESFFPLLAEKRWDEWIDLWAEDGAMEFPYAPPGRKGVYAGKPAILAYLQALGGKLVVEAIENWRVYPMLDPNLIVVEYGIRGHFAKDNAPYNQRYATFFEVRAGKLRRFREYWNPLVSIDAHGGREAWVRGFGQPEE